MDFKQLRLTKTLAMIGLQCPRKLYYQVHPQQYYNSKSTDPFLKALAEGGFQVGALAKIYHPEGIDLENLLPDQALEQTKKLLKRRQVTIFEATFSYSNLLVRVDILRKNGEQVDLIEVKAKSFDRHNDHFFDRRIKHRLITKWEPYLYDLAYQLYVCSKAREDLKFNPFLCLTDQNAVATVEGLNQKFILFKDQNKTKVRIADNTNVNTVGEKLLIEINVANEINIIFEKLAFEQKILELAGGLQKDCKLLPRLDAKCKQCEFRAEAPGLKSGFNECWSKYRSKSSLKQPLVFDVWYYGKAIDKALANNKILMGDLTPDDFNLTKSKNNNGLTRGERQLLQTKMIFNSDKYLNRNGCTAELASWQYPLHFIDFETSKVALPFNQGRKPYEQIAFQFSHHVVEQDGTINHQGQYLNDLPGQFPNFAFVRALKQQLGTDQGTIFRYSNHENTVLCDIIKQLQHSAEPDREELIAWLKTITKKAFEWQGERNMVDLCELVIKYFYHPLMGGSNSLKVVFPTILQDSVKLQIKYAKPIYGAVGGIKSLNFTDFSLITFDQNREIQDPYKQLPKLFTNEQLAQITPLFPEEELNHGGAAMVAYAKMQFTQMSQLERQQLRTGLLKYCELDTLAMVLLYEYLVENCGNDNIQ